VTKGCFSTAGKMGKQIGGQLQVNLRVAHALMAQIRGQHREFRVEISSFLVPLDQPVNGKRVSFMPSSA
jgi:hypothetical protein